MEPSGKGFDAFVGGEINVCAVVGEGIQGVEVFERERCGWCDGGTGLVFRVGVC